MDPVPLKAEVLARGSTLTDIPGVGPAGAARILADVEDRGCSVAPTQPGT